jgi:hypothetical protein
MPRRLLTRAARKDAFAAGLSRSFLIAVSRLRFENPKGCASGSFCWSRFFLCIVLLMPPLN